VAVSLFVLAGACGFSRFPQWTVTGTEHNANEVLCRQAECPAELALSEFVAFGTLRAGHRLQLRNILCAVATRSLSFDRPAVGDLLAQALPYRNRTAIKPRSWMPAQGPWAEVQTAIKPQSAGL